MKPQWDALVSELTALKKQWDALAPRLPEQINVTQPPNSISKEALSQALADTVVLVAATNQRDDIDAVMLTVHQQGLQNSATALKQALRNAQQNPVPQNFMQIISGIWSIRSSLVWILPPRLDKWIIDNVKDEALAAQIVGLKDAIQVVYKATDETTAKATAVSKATEEIQKAVEQIKGREREAGTAKTNAEANAAATATSKQAVETTLKTLADGLNTYNQLSENIGKLRQEVEATLEGASKVGLARSFTRRRKFLFATQIVWAFAFAFGILGLIVVPTVIYEKYISGLVKINDAIMWGLALRGALEAPIIWFTWFAVRQYGHTTRLVEDYAFKEAAAMSFVGYRKEMGNDKDMLKMLQESAIRSFGSNPVKILGKSDPSTPAHDLLEKALDKGGIDKVVELAKSLLGHSCPK